MPPTTFYGNQKQPLKSATLWNDVYIFFPKALCRHVIRVTPVGSTLVTLFKHGFIGLLRGGPRGGGSIIFPKVPQSSQTESLGWDPVTPPLEHPGTLRNPNGWSKFRASKIILFRKAKKPQAPFDGPCDIGGAIWSQELKNPRILKITR